MPNEESIPMLIPLNPEEFWTKIRLIIREEVGKNNQTQQLQNVSLETTGLVEKPLFKIQEICSLFKVTKPTIYDWIKNGKLKKIKIRSRVYFLGSDIRSLMLPE